jgi:hypothetical protein
MNTEVKNPKGSIYFDFQIGVGPMIKLVALLYLAYLTIFKNLKVPPLFFLLVGLANLLYINRFRNLSIIHKDYFKIFGIKSLETQPLFVEHTLSGVLYIIIAIYLYTK